MNNSIFSTDTKIGTIGGTVLVIICNMNAGEIIKAGILAATGAAVSFAMSLLCKWVWGRMHKKTNQQG